ncbi:MAG: hypothetical protein R3F60_18005 [bacterium]
MSRAAVVAAALLLGACGEEPGPAPDVTEEVACAPGDVDHPQALAFLGDTLVVASTGYATPTWGAGSVAFFDVEGARLGSVQPTRWQNPQGLAVHDGRVLVASTGVYDFSGDVPRMATPGGVEIFDPDHPATDRARSPSTSAPTAGRAAPSTWPSRATGSSSRRASPPRPCL